jgi:hypothetical protein
MHRLKGTQVLQLPNCRDSTSMARFCRPYVTYSRKWLHQNTLVERCRYLKHLHKRFWVFEFRLCRGRRPVYVLLSMGIYQWWTSPYWPNLSRRGRKPMCFRPWIHALIEVKFKLPDAQVAVTHNHDRISLINEVHLLSHIGGHFADCFQGPG